MRSWTTATGPRSHCQRCCSSYICGKGNLIGTLFYNLVLRFIWCDTSKKYHSAVPHENSAFKNFACASLIKDCEHISSI